MTRRSLLSLFSGVLVLAASSVRAANAQSSAIEGVARAQDSGAPIPFALVRLVAADSTASPVRTSLQGITSADGRYRFANIAPGNYRVQLLRIGFRPVLSEPVQVGASETIQLPFRVTSQPLTLPPVTVTSGACVTAGEFAAHPHLETLWQQARGGASIREGLMSRFRYYSNLGEESYELTAEGPTQPDTLDRPLVSDPRWALRNAERRRSRVLSRGYYGPNDGWFLPNELDVLHEDFLKAHCLIASVQRGEGEVGLRFQPLRTRRNFLDVRGIIWLDSATYLARRIELEYVDGEESRGTVRLDFGDVEVSGAMLRMPVGGEFAMRPSRKNPARRTAGKLTFTYSGFEDVKR